MQGQRGVIGSLPDTLDFDHGTASANAIVGQQICWNNMRNPAEHRLSDFMHLNGALVNPVNQEGQNLGGWNFGESSSNGGQNELNLIEQKTEHVWSSSTSACAGAGPRLDERRRQTNTVPLDSVNMNPQFIQSQNSDAIPQNLNLNAGFMDHGDDNFQVVEGSNMHKISGVETERNPSASSSNTSLIPSRSGGHVMEENDGRPGCSLDGRRQSCKRKAIEGNVGQASVAGSSSFFQNPESSAWPSVHGRFDVGSSLSTPVPPRPVIPRLGLGMRGASADSSLDLPVAAMHPEGSQRNLRLRMNPLNQESVPATLFSTGNTVRHSIVQHPPQSSRPLAIDRYDFRTSPAVDNVTIQSQPTVIPVSAVPPSAQSFRWNESSSSGAGSSSTPITLADREEANPRSVVRNLWEHPIPVPVNELRASVRNLFNRSVAGGVAGGSGNVASTSRAGPSSGSHPLTAPSWVPPPNASSRSSRRFAEYVRRSFFSSTIAESGGQGDLHTPLHLQPATSSSSSEEASGAANQVHHRSYPRSAPWMDRQGDGLLGIPYPLRTFTAGSEGRSRLVSEQIRNVLDLMRRGESLHLEDVMILDQSVFFGVADIHDRHRDMRLDVDNMSYEELLALEERIGYVSTGLSEETILKLLKQRKYSVRERAESEAEPCCICQEDYNDGEDIGTLDCGHDFHTDCVKQWLTHKNWCPICKTAGLATS